MLLACLLIPLAACGRSVELAPPAAQRPSLPEVPADIQQCFADPRLAAVPDRALTVAEVERLWASDRMRVIVLQRCGARFLSWYSEIKAAWL